jgi:UPF0176 protein
METYLIVAIYKFAALPDYVALRETLAEVCTQQKLLGTLLLAEEGLNGTLAGTEENVRAFLDHLKSDPRFDGLSLKESRSNENPFLRMKVRLKKEIVTLGQPHIDPTQQVGQYVKPEEWNALISRGDIQIIDTRNDYEIEVGSFPQAINPDTKTFRQFPEWVSKAQHLEKKTAVAMFCTGGIRCEKATSYMLEQGFEEVYHLEGGILKYLETIPKSESLWEGECFVFDDRVSVNHDLAPGTYDMCHGCRCPISNEDKNSPHYIQGVCCPRCHRELTDAQKSRFSERQKQIELAKTREEKHLGRAVPRIPDDV